MISFYNIELPRIRSVLSISRVENNCYLLFWCVSSPSELSWNDNKKKGCLTIVFILFYVIEMTKNVSGAYFTFNFVSSQKGQEIKIKIVFIQIYRWFCYFRPWRSSTGSSSELKLFLNLKLWLISLKILLNLYEWLVLVYCIPPG